MAETYGFFNGEQEYTQDDLLQYFQKCFQSGIDITEDNVMSYPITINGSTGVTIGPGFSILEGCFNNLATSKTLAIDTPTSYPRIDRVVIRVNYSAATCLVVVKEGTESSTPQPPVIERNNELWELSLYQVKKTITGVITIVDERDNKLVCGGLGPRYPRDLMIWYLNFRSNTESWFRTQQGTGWRQIFDINEGEEFPSDAEVGAICLVHKK